MAEEQGLPRTPCVFCGHGNPPSHRFCGMCGKALPDLMKQSKPLQSTSGSAAGGGGMGAAGRPTATPVSPTPPRAPVASPPVGTQPVRPAPAPRAENSNRDLSYLLHDDDHVPARTSRVPFLVGGLVLAAVAAFFILRGGGKKAPAVGTTSGDASVSLPAPDAGSSEAKEEPSKAEEPKTEPPKSEPIASDAAKAEPPDDSVKTEPEKAETPPAATPAPSHPSPAVVKAYPKPVPRAPRAQKKPSPSRQQPPAAAEEQEAPSPVSSGDDCESQLPSLRKAAARGDAKAKASLGMVYYAGQCVPRDLPTAYHWLALALRTAPDSPSVSAQLETIWKQMSPAERQLALK